MAYQESDELPEVFKLVRLRDICREFIDENKIDKPEKSFIVACGGAKSFDFIVSICNLIGYYGQKE